MNENEEFNRLAERLYVPLLNYFTLILSNKYPKRDIELYVNQLWC